jgi:hypothetical protein
MCFRTLAQFCSGCADIGREIIRGSKEIVKARFELLLDFSLHIEYWSKFIVGLSLCLRTIIPGESTRFADAVIKMRLVGHSYSISIFYY